ncbi:MAG: hypothetical protein FGM41_11505 [Bacteroidetes bacterium]|nr:hypothetical protein [Bacteroidota bacterium]
MKLIFTLTLILIFTNSQSQNCHKVKEIVTNRHEPNGHTKNHPYNLFDRHRETFQKTINEVRKRIFNDKPNGDIYKAYVTIYNKANESRPIDEGMPNHGISCLALWAKNNAFVMLVGGGRVTDDRW